MLYFRGEKVAVEQKENADAVLQVSISSNETLYRRLGRGKSASEIQDKYGKEIMEAARALG